MSNVYGQNSIESYVGKLTFVRRWLSEREQIAIFAGSSHTRRLFCLPGRKVGQLGDRLGAVQCLDRSMHYNTLFF